MKKSILASAIALIISASAFAQPVSDRAVIPIGVTLQQILRLHIINGGNIEFVFNDIADYTSGIANGATGVYDTQVTVASSTDWDIHMGAEDATLIGSDLNTNTIALNNIGFTCVWTGANTCCLVGSQLSAITSTGYASASNSAGTGIIACGLKAYAGDLTDLLLADSNSALGSGGTTSANAFTINWECGTKVITGTTSMNATSMLAQSPSPDRYVTNVLMDLVSN